ncbi:exosome complex protein LRP1, partial [Paragonimus westermani]
KSNLEVIKYELSLCYTLNALFFSNFASLFLYPSLSQVQWCGYKHSSNHAGTELFLLFPATIQDRVMAALKRCRTLSDKNSTSHLRCDKEAASRFIKHALWQSAHSKAKKRRPNSEQV